MAKAKTPSQNPAERLAAKRAELDALISQNEYETRSIRAALAQNPDDAAALGTAADLAHERHRLLAMCETLANVEQQQAAVESAGERRARVEALTAEIDALLEKRGEAAQAIAAAVEALAAPLAQYGTLSEDLTNAVSALYRLTGGSSSPHSRAPDTRALKLEESLFDALWRSGLGRTGPRMEGRVIVERSVFNRGVHPPIDDAYAADAAKLRAEVDTLVRAAMPAPEKQEAA